MRWTSKDPILFLSGEVNLYAYSLNNPINFNDPDGKMSSGRIVQEILKRCLRDPSTCSNILDPKSRDDFMQRCDPMGLGMTREDCIKYQCAGPVRDSSCPKPQEPKCNTTQSCCSN
jgi:hypothetical protein